MDKEKVRDFLKEGSKFVKSYTQDFFTKVPDKTWEDPQTPEEIDLSMLSDFQISTVQKQFNTPLWVFRGVLERQVEEIDLLTRDEITQVLTTWEKLKPEK